MKAQNAQVTAIALTRPTDHHALVLTTCYHAHPAWERHRLLGFAMDVPLGSPSYFAAPEGAS